VADVVAAMDQVARQLRHDATSGIKATELQQALAVITRIKSNLLALEQPEKSPAGAGPVP
jgi:hypothetical protein